MARLVKCLRWVAKLSLPTVRELDRARTNGQSLDPIDSIGWLLSITVGRNTPLEEISLKTLQRTA